MVQPGKVFNPLYWLSQWDLQQNAHIKSREERFNAMFDVISEHIPEDFRALDLACGPGSISKRLLERFDHAESVAVDYDPVLLHIGKSVLGDVNGRLSWAEANLREREWVNRLPHLEFDVIMSTTALHWIPHSDLRLLYKDLYRILKPGGIFMNGDHMKLKNESKPISEIMRRLWKKSEEHEFSVEGIRDWKKWWEDLEAYPELSSLLSERRKRYANPDEHNNEIFLDEHIEYLEEAGFKATGVIWQELESKVLLAIKE